MLLTADSLSISSSHDDVRVIDTNQSGFGHTTWPPVRLRPWAFVCSHICITSSLSKPTDHLFITFYAYLLLARDAIQVIKQITPRLTSKSPGETLVDITPTKNKPSDIQAPSPFFLFFFGGKRIWLSAISRRRVSPIPV